MKECTLFCFSVCLYVHSKAVTYKTGQSGMKMESDVLKVCGSLPIALSCLVGQTSELRTYLHSFYYPLQMHRQ